MRRKVSFLVAMVLGLTISLMLLPSQAVHAAGAVYYVDDDNCPGPGTGTQVDPFCSIQSGIDAASSGDTVQVSAGTYYENITMESGVVIQGAGQGVSIIDGGGNGTVVTAIGVDSAATLDGFTLTGGHSDFGGGMYIYNNSSPTVTNCTFSGNTANDHGGGMYIHTNSSPTVTNCTFTGNTADYGGAMYNFGTSSPTVTNCIFTGNTAANMGGGIYNDNNCSPTVTNCTFSENSASSGGGIASRVSSSPTVTNSTFTGNTAVDNYGGGMYNRTSPSIVTNCTFSGNTANLYGGGMYSEWASPTVSNCTFTGNTANTGGGGMCNQNSSSSIVTNSILWGDSPNEIYNLSSSPTVTYSDIQGGYAGTGNINADPLFAGGGDYHLTADSPCIDTGTSSGAPNTDFEGNIRPQGAGYDMGAYEFPLGIYYYVDDDNCPGPGTGTQVDPFCSIQSGIDAASSGDTVQVAAGTYYENITMKSGVVIQGAGQGVSIIDGGGSGSVVRATDVDSAAKLDGFTITNGVGLFGGGMYNVRSSPTVTNCTFSGNSANGNGGGMYNEFDSSPTVTNCTFSGNSAASNGGGMGNGFSSSPTVTNCTFSGNIASSGVGSGMYNDSSSPTVESCTFLENSASWGGGMFNSNSSPIVTNCTFSGNSAADNGGGMGNDSSSPTVTNCTFSGNIAASSLGGGMYNRSSSPTVTNCTFSGNSAALWGGGIFNKDSSSPIVTNCTFSENSASNGGGMYNTSSYASPIVTNCTFSGNTADYGGGMYNHNYSSPTVTNCTFSGNSAAYNGGGMYNYDNSSPTVNNSILWGNSPDEIYNNNASPSVTHSDIQGGYTGTGNINADPLFVDVATGDLHLQQGSPCIDAGDNLAPSLPSTDFEGDNRKIDDPTITDTGNGTPPIVDIGVDEFEPVVADYTATPTSGEEPLSIDFTDQSTGTITSWDWAFGDGATSTEKNPSHTYQDSGTFTVSLTVTRPGATDTETKEDLINVEPLDSDDDGLSDELEDTTCSDSLDADSDDDGILDGEEDLNKNGLVDPGETNPCNGDTDGDGIQDGTELGLTLDDIGPDTNTDIFQPDLDPTTTTDPLDPDSDNDGTMDGDEDGNHNGRVDQGERNPNVPDAGTYYLIPNKTGGAAVIYLE